MKDPGWHNWYNHSEKEGDMSNEALWRCPDEMCDGRIAYHGRDCPACKPVAETIRAICRPPTVAKECDCVAKHGDCVAKHGNCVAKHGNCDTNVQENCTYYDNGEGVTYTFGTRDEEAAYRMVNSAAAFSALWEILNGKIKRALNKGEPEHLDDDTIEWVWDRIQDALDGLDVDRGWR